MDFINKITNLKRRFEDYFLSEHSLGHLMDTAKSTYLFSIDSNEIYYELKNPKRFYFVILNLIHFLLFVLNAMIFSLSDYFYSLLKFEYLTDQTRILLNMVSIGTLWLLIIKIDFIISEMKSNLSPLKIFYYLMNNLRFKHKLTDQNHKYLAITSRIFSLLVLDVVMPITLITAIGLLITVAILSRNSIWILQTIHSIPNIIVSGTTLSLWMSIVFVLLSYYKLRFDQINNQIEKIISNRKVINKKVEKLFIKLINEHNQLSVEIHKLNLMMRRTAAATFFITSNVKIIALYLLINSNQVYIKFMMLDIFIILYVFCFGLTYLFSLQIESAHQTLKSIYSILCKFKMRFSFKLKVTLIDNIF